MICIQSNLPISDSALPTRGRGRGPRGNWLIKTRNRHILTKYWTISANRNENNKDKTITVIGVQFSSLNSISRGMKNTSVYGTRKNLNGRLTDGCAPSIEYSTLQTQELYDKNARNKRKEN